MQSCSIFCWRERWGNGGQQDWAAWSIPGAPISNRPIPQPAPRGRETRWRVHWSLLGAACSYQPFLEPPICPPHQMHRSRANLAINHYFPFSLKKKRNPGRVLPPALTNPPGCAFFARKHPAALLLSAANSCTEASDSQRQIWDPGSARAPCQLPAAPIAAFLHRMMQGTKPHQRTTAAFPKAPTIVQWTALPEDGAGKHPRNAKKLLAKQRP